jgi:colanic acid/amylovoran biosynthesis glycosyltransferase
MTVLHVWEQRSANGQRDLHWGLQQLGVHSVQCVRSLEPTGEYVPAPDVYAQHVASGSPTRLGAFLRRIERRGSLGWWRFERFVARHAERTKPEVLNAHFGTVGWRISGLADRLGLPLVVTFYGVDVSAIVRQEQWRRRYARLFERADALVVLCDAAAERLRAIGCPASKLHVWDHPLDLEAYTYAPRAPRQRTRLLIGARFVEKKGYPFLLDAFAKLRRDGRDLTLTAVGYGSGQTQVHERAAHLGLGDRFRLIDTAHIPDFDRFYASLLQEHDLFVLPSTTARSGDDEGGPALSLVLAQAAGLPVICTRFPGAERSVIEGETGLYCAQDDAEALAERIGYLVDRPELGARMAANANVLVRRRFELAGQADAMTKIYGEAMTRRRRNAVAPRAPMTASGTV